MKLWSLAFVAVVIAGVAAAKATNASHELSESSSTHAGVPVTTLHTPVTP